MAKTFCTRCKKLFDYDLYSGLCPHCGCFHQSPGVSNNNIKTITTPDPDSIEAEFKKHLSEDAAKGISHNDHKTGTADPHIEQMKNDVEKMKQTTYDDIKKNTNVKSIYSKEINLNGKNINGVNKFFFIIPLLVIIVIAIIFSIISTITNNQGYDSANDLYDDQIDDANDTSSEDSDSNIEYYDDTVDMTTLTEDPDDLETDTEIYGWDNSYYVNCAWEMADYDDISDYTDKISLPDGKCLIALDLEMYYWGEDTTNPSKFFLPSVYDGVEYCAPLDKDLVSELAAAYSIEEFSLDPEKIYSNPDTDEDYNDGFLYYIIDDACAYITVCMEFRDAGELQRTGYMEVAVQDVDSAYGDYDTTLDWDDFEEVPEDEE